MVFIRELRLVKRSNPGIEKWSWSFTGERSLASNGVASVNTARVSFYLLIESSLCEQLVNVRWYHVSNHVLAVYSVRRGFFYCIFIRGGIGRMNKQLVLQTDFGRADGAVSAMYGVALSVNPSLKIYDLTHEIPQYNIWEASYRLYQTVQYWPEDTVFVSVVDPGVGTDRLSVVAKTADGQYVVTPDNGTLTHLEESIGIVSIREIDETVNRLPNSGDSYTFHGRDVYVYTAARLAAGVISFQEVGRELALKDIVKLEHSQPEVSNASISGNVDILDSRFGNLWTNIPREMILSQGINYGDTLEVTISNNHNVVYHNDITLGESFAKSRVGDPILFINSLDKLGVAINQGSFASAYHILSGDNWRVKILKVKK